VGWGGPMTASVRAPLTVLGGAGFVGFAVVERCRTLGREVVSVDRFTSRYAPVDGITSLQADLLTDPLHDVLAGVPADRPLAPIVLATGNSDAFGVRGRQLVLDNAVMTARILPLLSGRDVTLVSSVAVYGAAPGR